MSLWSWAALGNGPKTEDQLGEIYPIPISQDAFVSIDVSNIYLRILTAVVERTDGIPDDKSNLMWDNCLASETQDGLISLLAKAMTDMSDLFIVYEKIGKAGVIRKATNEETEKIKSDYKEKGESQAGIYVTFKNLKKTNVIKFYSALEYCSVGGLYKQSNLSKAIQIKISELRASVALSDSASAKSQAQAIATGLKEGKDVGMDAKDVVETAKPDLTATNSALELIAQKQSFYLGLPASWIMGESSSGLSDTGKADAKAVERGLKPYFVSIIKPVVDALFEIKVTFKSEDFEMLTTANETLKVFELTSDQFISHDNKLGLINKLFGLPPDSKGDEVPEPTAPVDPNAPPPKPGEKPPDPKGTVPPPKAS